MKKSMWTKCGVPALAVVLACSLAACGNTSEQGGTAPSGSGSEAAKDAALQEAMTTPYGRYPTTVKYTAGRYTQPNSKLPEGDTYEDNAYTRYINEKLNVEIEDTFEVSGEDYDKQISLAIASDDLPDIFTINSDDILKELVEADLLADLTVAYENCASDYIKEIYDSYEGRCLEKATFDGKLLAIPGTNGDSAPHTVWVRQDWLDKLGMEVDPDGDSLLSVSELETIAKTFLDRDPGGSGNPVGLSFVPSLTDTGYGAYTIGALAGVYQSYPKIWMQNEDGSIFYGSTTEGTKQTLGKLKEWFTNGLLDPQFGTRVWDDITALLVNNQSGILFGPWHVSDWLLPNVRAMNPEAAFSAYGLKDDSGKINSFHTNAVSRYVGVSKKCKNPELVVKITSVLFDDLRVIDPEKNPELDNYLTIGVDHSARPLWIECGKYTSTIDGYREIMDVIEGRLPIEEMSTLGNQNLTRSIQNYLDHPATAEVSEWSYATSRLQGLGLMDKVTTTGVLSFVDPVFWGTTDTMKSKMANLNKLEEEMFVKIITGSEPLDSFEQFTEDWGKQGGNEIIAEIEKAIER